MRKYATRAFGLAKLVLASRPRLTNKLLSITGREIVRPWRTKISGIHTALPSTIYDLSFLSEQAKRNILGGNAMRLFKLDLPAKVA